MDRPNAVPPLTSQVAQLLRQLQTSDTATIRAGESELDALASGSPLELYDALSYLSTAPAAALGVADAVAASPVRSSAAVILRQRVVALDSAALERGALELLTRCRGRALTALQSVQEDYLSSELRKLCAVVAALGGMALVCTVPSTPAEGEEADRRVAPWPELLPAVYALAKSEAARQRAAGLYLFSSLIDYLDEDALEPHLLPLHEVLSAALRDADPEVRTNAVAALRALLLVAENKVCLKFTDLIPGVLGAVSFSLSAFDEDDTRKIIEELIEVAQGEPAFFRAQLGAVVDAMVQIASSDALEDETRQVALEFLTVCAEQLRGPCRRLPQFRNQVISICMKMMTEIEDKQEWYSTDSVVSTEGGGEEEDDDYSNADAGQGAIDRIALALGGKTVLPAASQLVQQFLQQGDDWRYRHAAVMTINQIGEGCRKQMESQLGEVLNLVLGRFSDPHPRVRWAAINCVGQMSTDFGGVLQRKYHAMVVPALVSAMDDSCHRVRSHAAAALINFCDEASASAVTPYLDALVAKLMALLNSNSRLAQEQAMTAVAAVAGCVDTAFEKYYESFMPPLKGLLRQSTGGDKRMRLMRGKTMECITLIGVAVGGDRFGADADEVMQILVENQRSMQFEPDDPQIGYMMQAYARICKSLGERFVPYLPYVMPALCETASHKPDIQVFPGGDADENGDGLAGSAAAAAAGGSGDTADANAPSEDGFATVEFGDKKIGIRTSALEDRSTAMSILSSFVSDLKGALFPYLEQLTQITVDNLTFWYQDMCRQYAANTMPELVTCAKDHFERAGQPQQAVAAVRELMAYLLPKVCVAARDEPEVEVQSHMIEAVGSILERAGPAVLQADTCLDVARFLIDMLKEREERVRERLLTRVEDSEIDEDELQNLEEADEWDDTVLSECADVVRSALVNAGATGFVVAFEAMLEPTAAPEEQAAAGETTTTAAGSGAAVATPAAAATATSLAQLFASMLAQERPAAERRAGLCAWAHWIAYGGERGQAYIQQVFPAFALYLNDAEAEVRQAAAYGIGMSAQRCETALFTTLCGAHSVIAALEHRVRHPAAREDDASEEAADNAASALLRIALHQPQCLRPRETLSAVLAYLPLQVDTEEANAAVELLARALRSHHALLKQVSAEEVTLALARQVAAIDEYLEAEPARAAREVFAQADPRLIQRIAMEMRNTGGVDEYEALQRFLQAGHA